MKVSPDGVSLAVGDRHGNIRIFNMELFKQIALVEAHDSEVLSVDYSRASDLGELMCGHRIDHRCVSNDHCRCHISGVE